jgi:hypothetical protein
MSFHGGPDPRDTVGVFPMILPSFEEPPEFLLRQGGYHLDRDLLVARGLRICVGRDAENESAEDSIRLHISNRCPKQAKFMGGSDPEDHVLEVFEPGAAPAYAEPDLSRVLASLVPVEVL